ncbi:uncharacterized protein LOC129909654 [Episyrphus balteatus]|uniref:uncharacterized protein LOC129909654 n=1 Tax=Episyrphus balteatus TaxID=286459 RepID=UPI002486480A|nr:uncharacterized protein LOC129909654 [Episyrphus balteatus]
MSTNQPPSLLDNSTFLTSFAEQKLLENFLRGTKLMKVIEDKTEQFINKYTASKKPEDARAPIVLDLTLHYKDLKERSQTLLCFLTFEPIEFLDSAKYLIYSLIKTIVKDSSNTILKTLHCEQVHVRFRFMGLPLEEGLVYDITPNSYPGGLAVLVCVLCAYTEPEFYTIQSIWYCTTGCQTNLIKKEVTKAPNCYNCARPMSEYSALRCMGKYRLLKVFPIRSVSTPRVFNKIFRSQIVHLKGKIFKKKKTNTY